MNYLLVIYTHKANLEQSKKMLETIKELNIQKCIIIGNPNLDEDYIMTDNIITLKCYDTYEHLTDKTIMLVKSIPKIYKNIKGIFKCDDDIILDVNKFNNFIKYFNRWSNIDYFGVAVPFDKIRYCGGPLYYLSINAINKLNNLETIEKNINEDMTIGFNLNKLNIVPYDYSLYTNLYTCFKQTNIIAYHNNPHNNDYKNYNEPKSYITMNNIGNNGRLGNQLFQLYHLLTISNEYNYKILLNSDNNFEIYNIFENLEIINSNDISNNKLSFKIYKEQNYHDYKDSYSFLINEKNLNQNSNINFHGYYQYIYNETPNRIMNYLQLFNFKLIIQEYCRKYIHQINENYKYKLVAIHIRLGDYLTTYKNVYNGISNWKNPQLIYKTIISLLRSQEKYIKFIIFSDEINKCKNLFKNENVIFYDCNKKYKYEDLYIMSQCNYFILSNSTYGLWAYLLCKDNNKQVFMPLVYYNINHPLSKYNQDLITQTTNINNRYLFTTDGTNTILCSKNNFLFKY